MCSPILIIGSFAVARILWGNNRGKIAGTTKEADEYEKANALLSDIVLNYKTVTSFGEKNVKKVFEKFSLLMVEPL